MLAITFVVVVLMLMGLARLLDVRACIAASLVYCAVAARAGCARSLSDDLGIALSWLRGRLADGYGVLFVVAALMAAQAILRGLRCPPLAWDSLVYHMFLPARWIQIGGVEPFAAAGGMDCARAFPFNLELLVAWVCLPWHGDVFANLVNVPILLLTGAAAYAICRELDVRPRLAIWAPVFFCFSPPMWSLVTTQYVDPLVAATMLTGTLFVLRYVRTNAWRDVLLAAVAFGLAVGTKQTAVPTAVFVFVCLSFVVVFNVRTRRAKRVLLAAFLLAFVLGGYQYIRNWIELDNPAYPWPVRIAGHEVFGPSPLIAKDQHVNPAGTRTHDWAQVVLMLSPKPLCWGLKYALIAPLALLALVGRSNRPYSSRLLATIGVVTLLFFFVADSTGSAGMRRRWPETSMRMFAMQVGVMACAATYVLSRASWPRWIVPAIPTLLLLLDWLAGGYSQPLHPVELFAIGGASVACLYALSSKRITAVVQRCMRRPVVSVLALLMGVAAFAAGAQQLVARRDAARHFHYANSVDYHDFVRDLVPAWKACDEPDHPHVIAYAGERDSHGDTGFVAAVSRWFWYPLLGSQWQNRAVYASIYEERDIPSGPYRAAMVEGWDERIWLRNLARLRVDRVLLVVGEEPEGEWLAGRVDVFRLIEEGEKFRLYAVDRANIARAITAMDTP